MLRTTRQAKVQSAPTLAKKPLRRSLNPIVTIWLSVTFTAIVLGVVQTELSLHSGEESAALQESFLWSSPSLEKQQPSSSYFVSRPRQVSLVLNGTSSQAWFESYHFIEPIQVQVSLEVSNFKQAGRTYENAKIIDPPPPETGNCIPMGEWQSSIFPNCNSAHEISLQPGRYVEFINCGGDRCAFQLSDDSNSIVLKIPKWSRDFEEHDFRKAAKDGVAMEHLSHSNYILDIYGYCGLSQVIELGDKGGNLHDLIKTTKYQTRPFVSDLDKLKIGYQIASAVSDMHGPDPSLIPIAHNDICCHQFILVNGIYKLNDFHLAAFQKRNKQTGTTCPGKNWYSRHYILIRSPEEMPRGYSPISLEKSDVYTMGNILYYTLSMGFLWPDLESVTDAVERTKNGERSPFDSSLIHSQDPSIQAMIQSIQWSWTQDPDKRPRAVEVQMYLRQQLETILGIERLTLDHVRVQSIEPLPSDHSFSDGDFKIMFKSEKRQRDIQRRRKKLEQSKTKDRPKKDQRHADFASLYSFEDLINPTCVKSRTGYVISIAGCPVSWISQLQTDIKSRTMEAEYNALSMTMKDVIPVQNLFPSASVGIGLDNITSSTFKTTVWEDNTGCLKLATFHPVNTLHDPSTMQ